MLDLNNIANITKEQFNKLNVEEQKLVLTILDELSKTGKSETLDNVWYQDYNEIPVSIKEFITNPYYLGKSTRNGESIYPYWRKKYNEIFDESLGYEEIVLTGAIGVGKTRTAVVCLAYMLYKIMCLKNPQEYFKFNEGDKITIFFLNINLRLAEGVGFKTLHQYLLNSPWFMERGTQTGRTNLIYNPPHNIGITFGSKSDHALGQQVFCLHGDTEIYTEYGIYPIKELENAKFRVFAYDITTNRTILSNTVTAMQTTITYNYYQITFGNGCIIKCTENHLWLMDNGKYKKTKNLKDTDMLCFAGTAATYIVRIDKITSKEPIKFYDIINVHYFHNFIVKCCGSLLISHNCAFMDEVDFTKGGIKGGDVLNAQNGIMQAYTTIKERINSRFIKNGVQYGRLFLVSSKKSEHDFIEAYVRKMQSEGQSDKMLIVDEPQWVIKPEGTFSKETFPVAVGNRSLKSRVLNSDITEDERKALIKQGYEILDVPVNLKQSFIIDVNTALMNLAGRSVVGATSFFNFDMFSKCYIKDYHNPFTTDIITMGIKDDLQIADFFEIKDVPEAVRAMPQFIHIDASLTGDKTGISSVGVSGLKETVQYNGANEIVTQEMTYKHIFSVDIQAPQGAEISFEKTRQFIYYLKASGFNIKAVSLDGFQSADTKQMLLAQGYDASVISLDKTPQGYLALRSAMNDERIGLIQIDLLETELIQLQRDVQTGKIDHPVDGCFTGDTLIRLADGTCKQIIDLVGQTNLRTIGYNIEKDDIKPVIVKKVFLTKYVNTLIQITLHNSSTPIRCTLNHRFLLSSGIYKEASELTTDDILMGALHPVKIQHIEILKYSDPIPVFDMEVPETHNFLLECGVFVHNSKDMSDSLAGALWNATLHKQSLIDGLELLESALGVNDTVDPQQEFISDLQNSLANSTMTTAQSKMNELLTGFNNADIISW